MASPWKFLARLTSRRPLKEQDTSGDQGTSETLPTNEAIAPALPDPPNDRAAPDARDQDTGRIRGLNGFLIP